MVLEKEDKIRATLVAKHIVDKDGGIAEGVVILTDQGLEAVVVATTHGGVKDSEAQANASDPVWHTHYVKLGVGVTGHCGESPEVVDITFEEPADVSVNGKAIRLTNVVPEFTGTHSLTGETITLAPGLEAQNVVSFGLVPVFEDGNLQAVCVEPIDPADRVTLIKVFHN